jgi:deoxycytidylate deaminase
MSSHTSVAAQPNSATAAEESPQTISVSERRTDELVIALVGAIGSGVTTTGRVLVEALQREYNYTANYIKVSTIIKAMSQKLGESVPGDDVSPTDRTSALQRLGNVLRKRYSNRYLAEKCIERIAVDRLCPPSGVPKGYEEVVGEGGQENRLPVNRRRVHVIDSIKHTDEVEALREVYGDTFWLFGVFAPETVREERLTKIGFDKTRIPQILEDDEEDGLGYGQKVRDTIHQSDFFVRNDELTEDRLNMAVGRYLKIIFNIGVNTPTLDETAMYSAASQASTSACLSRQVGAAIFSAFGELIGVGANDVPKFGGGLYCSEDGAQDHRCFKLANGICHNDDRKRQLYLAILRELRQEGILIDGTSAEKVIVALKRTDIKNLIEYSRAVHAEMEAIISVGRGNKPGLVGATLYCTTFPCHSCARHIVASGIKHVFFIEPYAKSLAVALHGDAVSMKDRKESRFVTFLQYEGTAPKNMIRLFKHGLERKRDGRAVKTDPRRATPIFRSPLDGFTFREKLVVDNLMKNEQNKSSKEAKEGEVAHGGQTKETGSTQLFLVDTKDPPPT